MLHHIAHRLVDCIVRTDEEIRAGSRQLTRRRQHEIADTAQVVPVETLNVGCERMRMHRHFGVPRPMKMGTIRSLFRYDAMRCSSRRPPELRRPAMPPFTFCVLLARSLMPTRRAETPKSQG